MNNEQPEGVHVGYFPTVMDGAVARFRWAGGDRDIVNASREGIVVQTPEGVWSGERLAVLYLLIRTAERVHLALALAYARGPSRRTDLDAVILEALGPGWTLDRPALLEKWPPNEESER